MKVHKPRESSAPVASDPRLNDTWEWHATATFHSGVDARQLGVLGADLSFEGDSAPNDALTHDPYNRSPLARSSESRPGRSLQH